MNLGSNINLSWKEQLKGIIRTASELSKYINLTNEEMDDISKTIEVYPMAITPYYASLMDKNDRNCPIRRMVIPNKLENIVSLKLPDFEKEKEFVKGKQPEESLVGLREEYDGKATILTTMNCQSYCRHCFRKYWIGKSNETLNLDQTRKVIDTISKKEEIKEVCISGGDPLILPDKYIAETINGLKDIKHVEVVRLYSRTPVTMPQRITPELIGILKQHPTLYFCTHFNHPKELTKEATNACRSLVDNGIPVLNQAVLLKGVNDDSKTMKELLWGLVKNKVKPFYLQHCIKQTGNDHLVTEVKVGTEIIRDLYCHMSAIAIPLYDVILYGGKALMMPDYVKEDETGEKYVENLKSEKSYLSDLENH